MTLEDIKSEINIKGYVTLRQAIDFSRKHLKQGVDYDEYGEPTEEGRVDIYELAKIFIKSNQSGDKDDYHNYAVIFGILEDNTMACDILLCGLKKYPRNVDLLADFLLYALSSSKDEHYNMCADIYERLLKINKKRWSWRAFDFSISYLIGLLDKDDSIEEDKLKESMLELAHEYQQYHPKSELGYVAQARIMKKFGDKDEQDNILLLAFSNNIHAPRSAMMLAENSFGKKEYDVAINYFQRLQSDQIDQLYNVSSPGHAYMLSFLTKTAQFLQENSDTNYNSENNQKVLAIHRDYLIAKKLKCSPSELETAKQYIALIEVMSGIPFNDDDIED